MVFVVVILIRNVLEIARIHNLENNGGRAGCMHLNTGTALDPRCKSPMKLY